MSDYMQSWEEQGDKLTKKVGDTYLVVEREDRNGNTELKISACSDREGKMPFSLLYSLETGDPAQNRLICDGTAVSDLHYAGELHGLPEDGLGTNIREEVLRALEQVDREFIEATKARWQETRKRIRRDFREIVGDQRRAV